jgi:hypothetical protein
VSGHTCYHCKQWVEEGEAHDCWTTTEGALTSELTEDLREAWERLRDAASELGEQRIYASHSSIMFSRRSCYCFVRPKRSFLEVNVFLGRTIQAPQIRRVVQASVAKAVHVIQIRHRDEVESPITDWLAEAYEYCESAPRSVAKRATKAAAAARQRTSARKKAQSKTTKARNKTSPAPRAATKRAAKPR